MRSCRQGSRHRHHFHDRPDFKRPDPDHCQGWRRLLIHRIFLGVTGTRTEIKTDLKDIIDTAKAVTDVPCAVGFGINTTEQAEAIGRDADGVIVGSAIVKLIAKYGDDAGQAIFDYVKGMKEAAMRSLS